MYFKIRSYICFLYTSIENPEFLKEALDKYGPTRIVVGVDVKDEFVATSGSVSYTHLDVYKRQGWNYGV